jgi:hypothetical protein
MRNTHRNYQVHYQGLVFETRKAEITADTRRNDDEQEIEKDAERNFGLCM